jgi:uncharacterized protein YcaQ
MDALPTNTETAPFDAELEALYDDLFGTPVLDAVEEDTEQRDELDAYATVYEVAKERPAVARKAAQDGTPAHYRGVGPFDYAIRDRRTAAEAGGPD